MAYPKEETEVPRIDPWLEGRLPGPEPAVPTGVIGGRPEIPAPAAPLPPAAPGAPGVGPAPLPAPPTLDPWMQGRPTGPSMAPPPEMGVDLGLPAPEEADVSPTTQAPVTSEDILKFVTDELKQMSLASLEEGAQSLFERVFWGEETPTNPTATKVLAQLAYDLFWRWGAEVMYELPKVPERIGWALGKPLAGWTPSFDYVSGHNPYQSLVLASIATRDPSVAAEYDVPPEILQQIRDYDVAALKGALREGEIGYTFAAHPERLLEFRQDVADGMDFNESIRKHQDFWFELGMNVLVDPAMVLPAGAMKLIWPGGYAVGKYGTMAIGKVFGATIGKLPVGKWLGALSKRTLQTQRVAAVTDAMTELVLRTPAGEAAADVATDILRGNLTKYSTTMSDSATETLAKMADDMTEDGIRSMDDLVGRYLPEIADGWQDDAVQAMLGDNPQIVPYLFAEATKRRAAVKLGITPASERGALARALDFTGGLLKEHWLSTTAYMAGNQTDNVAKTAAIGHFINPFDLHADARVTQYMSGYQAAVPHVVLDDFIRGELGIEGISRMSRVPVPGIGKPSEIVDFYDGLLGINLRAQFPSVEQMAPRRVSSLAEALDLAESPGRAARILDRMNWASITDSMRGVSGAIERSARVQVFQDVFTRQINGPARQRLVQAATSAGLPDDLVRYLGSSAMIRSPDDIVELANRVAVGKVPVVRLSSLIPEGATDDLVGRLARELDSLQDEAIAGGAKGVEALRGQVDELFDAAEAYARSVQGAGEFEAVLADWHAQKIRDVVEDALGRSRELGDNLLAVTREQVTRNPDMAGVVWPRYFDAKADLMEAVQTGVSRVVRERATALSDDVDNLMARHLQALGDNVVDDLNVEDWGVFGQRLAGLREEVDAPWQQMWKAFLDDPTTERLHDVEVAYDAVYDMWQGVADEASVWRDGFLSQGGEAGARITRARYEERMNEIWERGFGMARQAYEDAITRLGAEVAPDVAAGVGVRYLTRAGGEEVVESLVDLPKGATGAYFGATGEMVASPDLAHLELFAQHAGQLPPEGIEATERALQYAGQQQVVQFTDHGTYLGIDAYSSMPPEATVVDSLHALRDSGVSGGKQVYVDFGPFGDEFKGTLDDAIAELSARLGLAAPAMEGGAVMFRPVPLEGDARAQVMARLMESTGMTEAQVTRTWPGQQLELALRSMAGEAGEGFLQESARYTDIQADMFIGMVSPQGDVFLSPGQGMTHQATAQAIWGRTEDDVVQGLIVTHLAGKNDIGITVMRDVADDDILPMVRQLVDTLDVPADVELHVIADRKTDLLPRPLWGPRDEVLGQLRQAIARGRARDLGVRELAQEPWEKLQELEQGPSMFVGGQEVQRLPEAYRPSVTDPQARPPAWWGESARYWEQGPMQPQGWTPFTGAPQGPSAVEPPSAAQLKEWLAKGNITAEQYDQYMMQLQVGAQAGFASDYAQSYAQRMTTQAQGILDTLGAWRQAVRGNLDQAVQTRMLEEYEQAALRTQLETLSHTWANEIQDASIAGAMEVRRVLFDYTINQNWEEVLRYAMPFTKWQLRNPFIWADIISSRPWVGSIIEKWMRASEQIRSEMNLTSRFERMLPVPGQEWLQQRGALPGREGGYWGFDPSAMFSLASQVRQPMQSPAEEELTGWRKWANIGARAPETLGMHFWPWIEEPLRRAGVFGNAPPWGVLGAPGRLVPGLRRVEEQIAEARAPGSSWINEYTVRRRIAEMVEEGRLTELEAAEGQFDPTSAAYQEAEAEVRREQDFASAWRTMVPFGLKYASPGELGIREQRERLRGMPPERAGYLRELHPATRAYGRGIAAVEEPEQGAWMAERDAVNARYDQMIDQLPPWHPRVAELNRARWAEIDELGPEPQVTERGYAPENERDAALYQLEQQRPRAQDFANERTGEIDWDAYNTATRAFMADVPTASGGLVTPEEYQSFRRRYLSPLEMAWEMREEQLSGGWDEYARLRALQMPEQGAAPEIPGMEPAWREGAAAPSISPEWMMGQAPEEMRPWLGKELEQRTGAGATPWDVYRMVEGRQMPFEAVQEQLQEGGFGPKPVREMVPELLEARPWLKEQGWGAEEWGGIYPWLDVEMPGMFEARSTEEEERQAVVDWFYDLMPSQRDQVQEAMRIGEGEEFTDWFDALDPQGQEWAIQHADWLRSRDLLPTEGDRLAVELDMLRWEEGEGEWSDLMDQYYGDPTSPRSEFWDYYFDNKYYFTEEYREDDVVRAALSRDVRSIIPTDAQDPLFEEALERLRDQYYDPDEAERWQQYPDLVEQANAEREEFNDTFVYDDKPADGTPAEQEWWDDRTTFQQQHPVMMWFYWFDKYEKWWGDEAPGDATAYQVASTQPYVPPPTPTPVPVPAPPPEPEKKKKGTGGGSSPGGGPPSPPSMP